VNHDIMLLNLECQSVVSVWQDISSYLQRQYVVHCSRLMLCIPITGKRFFHQKDFPSRQFPVVAYWPLTLTPTGIFR